VGVGLSFVIAPLYGAEIAPQEIRAAIISVTEILISFGVLLGYLSAELLEVRGFEGNFGWRFVISFASIPALLILCCWRFLPESPRWLVQVDRREEAEQVLRQSRGCHLVHQELLAIDEAISAQRAEVGWKQILCPTPQVFRMLLAGVGISFFQQASGSEAIVYYTPIMLKDLGVETRASQNRAAMAVGAAKLAGACGGAAFLDLVGRRPAIIVGSMGVAGCLAGLAFMQDQEAPPVALGLSLLCGYMFVFEIGLAAVAFVLGTECFPMELRGKALSLGMFTTRSLSGVVSLAFPKLEQAFSLESCLWGFFSVAVLGIVWATFCVPETKGVALEDVTKLFDQPISWFPEHDSDTDSSSDYEKMKD